MASPGSFAAARSAVTAIFFMNGATFANWVPRIPQIMQELGLNEGELGLALLGLAVGAVTAMPLAGWATARIGSRPATGIAGVAFGLALMLIGLAWNLPSLACALALLGATNSVLDIAMNAQGIAVDRRYERPIFASFHAAFSFGFVAGAITGSVAAAQAIDPFVHFGWAGVVLATATVVLSRWLLPADVDAAPGKLLFQRPSRALAGLGAIAFCAAVAEGAAADWSAFYMADSLDVGAGLAGSAFAAFALAMGVGRLVVDRLTVAWGAVTVVRRGGILAAAALSVALVADSPWAAVAGFAGLGGGLAAVFPLSLAAAGRMPDLATAASIATVSTTGYFGFVAGPPIIGFAAEAWGLPVALSIVVAACIGIIVLARSVTSPPRETLHPTGQRAQNGPG